MSSQTVPTVRPRKRVTIRSIGPDDAALVIVAQEAMQYEADAATIGQIVASLHAGILEGMVLEGTGRRVLIGWMRHGPVAYLCGLYSDGEHGAGHFLSDLRRLYTHVKASLAAMGVKTVMLSISEDNPHRVELQRLFARGGFYKESTRYQRSV